MDTLWRHANSKQTLFYSLTEANVLTCNENSSFIITFSEMVLSFYSFFSLIACFSPFALSEPECSERFTWMAWLLNCPPSYILGHECRQGIWHWHPCSLKCIISTSHVPLGSPFLELAGDLWERMGTAGKRNALASLLSAMISSLYPPPLWFP